jgi:hypothetical protein
MGFLSDYYGKQSPEFIKGFLAAMDMYAVWKDGKRFMGIMEMPLKQAMHECISELAEVPEDFEEQMGTYTN